MSGESKITYNIKALPDKILKLGIALTVVGFILVVLAYFTDNTRAAFNNIILLMFLTSIGIGSLFLVAIEHIAGAVWSTPFRRIIEITAGVLLVLPIVALPSYFNIHDLFHWTHTEVVEADKILSGKSGYLNETFFTLRIIGYFVVWFLFYYLLTKNSYKQDKTKDQNLTTKNIRLSAVFLPFFAITITFSSIDWMMSLEPHWFSTIFGVYYFSGTVLTAVAVATFLVVWLNENGYLPKGIVSDHYYSLGALMFAFVNFWAYIAFSQYLLIWYANLPEETIWFLQRWEGGWIFVSIILIIVHFLIPYFGLVSQPSKTNPKRLKSMALWIIAAHFVDLYWIVMPTYGKEEVVFGWIELAFPILAIGIMILIFTLLSKKKNLVPIGDPKLKRGMDFRL